MDSERQKPVTDEYRENFDRVFGSRTIADVIDDALTLYGTGKSSKPFRVPFRTYPQNRPIFSEKSGTAFTYESLDPAGQDFTDWLEKKLRSDESEPK